ncbi:MAG TPA: hypothetical protein VK563_13290 [Puia sp.]|nr:hypothetical protein [Puia sp.]
MDSLPSGTGSRATAASGLASDTSPLPFYKGKIAHYSTQLSTVQKRLNLIALLRLISFSGLILAGYFLIKAFAWPLLFIALISLAAFIFLILLTLRLRDHRALLEQLLFVNSNELGVLANGPNGFPDGQPHLNGDSYLDDLDIFGRSSLFHMLNRTTTSHGSEKLAGLLKQPLQSCTDIENQQAALRTLVPQTDKRQLLTAHGLLTGEKEGNLYGLAGWLATEPRLLRRKGLLAFRWILIVWNIGGTLLYLDTGNFVPLVAGVAVSWILNRSFSAYISEQHALISRKQAILNQYAAILAVFNTTDGAGSGLLQQLLHSSGKAHTAIRRLSQLSSFFDQRLNLLVNIFLNSFLLYDLQVMIALENWKEANRKDFPQWVEAVGSIECLNSLAAFAFNNPDNNYPLPVDDTSLLIRAEKMAHPLIPAEERVPNDFVTGSNERLLLITGSNMSGKTTFLRTTGVNLLLAQCGAPVCAASFSFTPMQILSSLRVSDSLQEHTSYFMAELKKLQQIIHRLQSGLPSLVLIDEILRGTNSEDKTYGSEKFIRKLLQYNCLSLFATHDLSLGKLESEMLGIITNYCFESVIEQGELHFNYLLQRGIARNRNASFLMEKMEII